MDIEKLLQDEEFKAQLTSAKDFGEAAKLLNARGIEVTEEQLKAAAAEEDELDENALEDVAGGYIGPLSIKLPCPYCGRWFNLYSLGVHIAAHMRRGR